MVDKHLYLATCNGAEGRTRTDMPRKGRQDLNLVRLPISPLPQFYFTVRCCPQRVQPQSPRSFNEGEWNRTDP